jgi:hypothetical protein
VKVLRNRRVSPKLTSTYVKEVKLLQSFNHPNVLRFVGVCCEPQHVCIGAALDPKISSTHARGARKKVFALNARAPPFPPLRFPAQ